MIPATRRTTSRMRIAMSALTHAEDEVDSARHPRPRRALLRQALATGARERVEPRLTIVLGHAPLRCDVSLTLEAIEGRIQGSLPDLQHPLGPGIETLRDAPAMHRPELQCLEHEHVERALQHVPS